MPRLQEVCCAHLFQLGIGYAPVQDRKEVLLLGLPHPYKHLAQAHLQQAQPDPSQMCKTAVKVWTIDCNKSTRHMVLHMVYSMSETEIYASLEYSKVYLIICFFLEQAYGKEE